ncbi:MAG: phage major capsid protein [Clostridiales bacterium]|nr:phage major capsid protein [Clostridiales bacterium]
MTKKMRELQAKLKDLIAKAKEETDLEAKANLIAEANFVKAELVQETELFNMEKGLVPDDPDPVGKKVEKASGFMAMLKAAGKKKLTEAEAALVTGNNAQDGENLLVPEDVRLKINENRRSFKAAKELVSVMPTDALTGEHNHEAGSPAGLIEFADGDEITEETNPKFIQKDFKIRFFGKLIPISNILKGAEEAGLMAYLNRWFIKNAIISENKEIFAKLKQGKTAKALASWKVLKTSINKDLDPDARIDAVIVTNQSGFDILDSAEDKNGRPILQENPADKTKRTFQGLPVEVFSDAQLPNEGAKGSPIFYGNLKNAVWFYDYMKLEFATSEHFLFSKNQTTMRVIEGFDVIQADSADENYIFGYLKEETPAAG